jgi:hypothetical protein
MIVYIFPYKSIWWVMMTNTYYTNSHLEYPAILKIYTLLVYIRRTFHWYIHQGYISMRGKLE